jgi:hypothetical protein
LPPPAAKAALAACSGVRQQLNGGSWQPLAFYSKKLSGAGTRYFTFDRELLAAFSAVRNFRFLLEGQQFHLLTDHKPLVTSLFRTTLQITTQAVGDETLLGDVSTGVFRPLVPIQHREAVFQSLHSIHHPGVRATRRPSPLGSAGRKWPRP